MGERSTKSHWGCSQFWCRFSFKHRSWIFRLGVCKIHPQVFCSPFASLSKIAFFNSDFKPQLTQEGDCQVSITTCAYNSYPIDPLDFGGLISADVTKAKFKLEDVIQEGICSDSITRKQCKDANIRYSFVLIKFNTYIYVCSLYLLL